MYKRLSILAMFSLVFSTLLFAEANVRPTPEEMDALFPELCKAIDGSLAANQGPRLTFQEGYACQLQFPENEYSLSTDSK